MKYYVRIVFLSICVTTFVMAQSASLRRVCVLSDDAEAVSQIRRLISAGAASVGIESVSRSLSEIELGTDAVIVMRRPLITRAESEALVGFAAGGGQLVLMGRAALQIDVDGNGRFDTNVDTSLVGETDTPLAMASGAIIVDAGWMAEALRTYRHTPLTEGIFPGRWLSVEQPCRASALKLRVTGGRVLAGAFLAPNDHPPGSAWYGYSGPPRGGEYPLLVIHRHERGVVLRVAEDLPALTEQGHGPAARLMMNLVSLDLGAWLATGYEALQPVTLQYGPNGNLLFNGDFHDSRRVRGRPSESGALGRMNHLSETEYFLPLGWRFTAEVGYYAGQAVSNLAGATDWAVSIKSLDGEFPLGRSWAGWEHRQPIELQRGATYELRVRMKLAGSSTATATLFVKGDPAGQAKNFSLPTSSDAWETFAARWQVPFAVEAGSDDPCILQQLRLSLHGAGRAWFDDVYFSRVE